jgi:hypothetical protein
MRSFAFKFGLGCAAIWILLKLVIFFAGKSIEWFDFAVMANNFFLLTSVSLTIFFFKKSQGFPDVPKLDDVKTGIFGGIIYTLLVVLFSYFYNANLDSAVLDSKVEQRIEQVAKAIETEDGFKAYLKVNTEASKFTKEQIIDRERESTQNFLNPKVSALILLMFFMLLSIFYAFFITVVIRKIYLPGLAKR